MGGSGQRMGGSGQRVKKWAKNAVCGQRCNFVGQRKINDSELRASRGRDNV